MRRRNAIAGGGAAAAIAGAAILLGGGSAEGRGARDGERTGDAPRATAEISRRDLTETEDLDGTLGYGDATDLTLPGSGTVTDLADEGSVVEAGGVLAELDGEPVVLLAGGRAPWRQLDAGASDGEDVRQLEQNLVDLGYGTAEALGPDGEWTAATTAALKRLQAAIGAEEDGALELGTFVFAPGAVRVASHLVTRGAAAGQAVMEVTGTERVVTIDLPADDRAVVEVGQEVQIELPDGTAVDGSVRSVADVVDPPAQDGADPTVEVVVAFDDPSATGAVDQAPVEVAVVTVAVANALTVPVEALLALAEGGYAVERPDGSLVGVRLGAFADGFVQITPTTGSLEEGDEVVVPE